jgi:adenine deaminase
MQTRDPCDLIDTALGRRPADLAIRNAALLNVYTGELQPGVSVCTCGSRIACVGELPAGAIAADTEVLDAGGRTLLPGFIDSHTHVAGQFHSPWDFVQHVLPGGTTTAVTETLEAFVIAGIDGLRELLQAFAEQPMTIYSLVPPNLSTSSSVPVTDPEELGALLKRDDVIGLGESYWQEVLNAPQRLAPLFRETLSARKPLQGHSAGASGPKLNAYLSTGISSCHEPIREEEGLERLRLGCYVMIREGGIRQDLDKLAGLRNRGVDLRRCILVTDSVEPEQLAEGRYMDAILQKGIDLGIEPVEAVRMATLNPAVHFGLDHELGGIGPGKFADMVLVPNPRSIRPETVVSKGRIVARDGRMLVSSREHDFSARTGQTVKLTEPLRADSFRIAADSAASLRVRVIEQATDLVTRAGEAQISPSGGEIRPDPAADLLKVAAVDRIHQPGKSFTGLIRGWGLRAGAVASSAPWDSTDIVVLGADEADMAVAVNRLRDLQGGIAVARGGRVRAELPLPVFGIIARLPLAEVVSGLQAIRKELQELGCRLRSPVLTLNTLTCAAIPFLRICEQGLVDLKAGRTLGLFP